jgi:hypothetical protein
VDGLLNLPSVSRACAGRRLTPGSCPAYPEILGHRPADLGQPLSHFPAGSPELVGETLVGPGSRRRAGGPSPRQSVGPAYGTVGCVLVRSRVSC